MLFVRGRPSLNSRVCQVVLAFVVVALFFQTIRTFDIQTTKSPLLANTEVLPDGNAAPEELYLSKLGRDFGLTNETSWMAWKIQPIEQSEGWPSVTEVNLDFASVTPKVVNLEDPKQIDLYAKKRMSLPVPISPLLGQVDASDFLLGISTTYARIVDRDYAMIKAWSRWLTDGHHHSNGASLVVVLDQANNEQLEEVDRTLQATGIDCWVTTTEEPMSMARRYLELSRILKVFAATLAGNGQDKRWFGLVEDDVFFPSLSHLRDRLFSYNTGGQHYIALPSEKLDWDTNGDEIETYGGGAVLLTLSTVSRIPDLPCFEKNPTGVSTSSGSMTYRAKRWDELLYHCVMKHLDIDMHVLPGFYSPNDDSYDEEVDSYETGQQPLLLRRYAERHLLNINKAHLVTNVCGESCFMQRYLFQDNWVLVNGISLTKYTDVKRKEAPEPTAVPVQQRPVPKRTKVDDGDEDIDRASLTWTGHKQVWRMADSAVSKDGAVWQAYVKKAEEGDAELTDSVIVLIWEQSKIKA